MIKEDVIRGALDEVLMETAFSDLGQRIEGKVRDSYVREGRRTIVATDRISAFDVVLGGIPFKGQVLNGIAAHWFARSAECVPNHLVETPDPAVSIVEECTVFPVEMIVRGYLTGSSPTSIWTCYEAGSRDYCGHRLDDGMVRHQKLPHPLITPTTKAPSGQHDELTSRTALVESGTISAREFDQLAEMSLSLYELGVSTAADRGLILVDTKYEFGRRKDGRIVVVDEVHTPDSSRYWYVEGYEEAMRAAKSPRALDKDFLRQYLIDQGYQGEGQPPQLSPDIRVAVAQRYLELYEALVGRSFEPNLESPLTRIARNLGLG